MFFYFCPEILLTCRTYVEKFRNGSKYVCHTTARQSYYCNNYFVKSEEKINQHISVCATKVGITYSFDNAKIIDYQDNYRYMGDVPFTVYFDYETTTGNAVFFDTKMFVVSYCMIVSFNKLLSFPKIVIYRSFDQNPNEIENISHFSDEYQPFFDLVTLNQLSDAARAVTRREKSTSLAEMFSIKLKFTVDTRKAWFEKIIKQRFVDFFDPEEFETFRDLREEIENIDIPKRRYGKKIWFIKDKLVAFLYERFIDFVKSDKVKGVPIYQKFISNVIGVLTHKNCIHHSHVTGEVVGHSHAFCNEKVRENYYTIPVVAHNLFRFDFFFLMK